MDKVGAYRYDLGSSSGQRIAEATATGVVSLADYENLLRECEQLRAGEREAAQLTETLEQRLAAVEQTYNCAEYLNSLEERKREIETHVQRVSSRVQSLEQWPQQEEAVVQTVTDQINALQQRGFERERTLMQLREGEQQLNHKSLELMQLLEVLEAQAPTPRDLELLQAQHNSVQQHAAQTEQRLRDLAAQSNAPQMFVSSKIAELDAVAESLHKKMTLIEERQSAGSFTTTSREVQGVPAANLEAVRCARYAQQLNAAEQGIADAQKGHMEFAQRLSSMSLRANSVEAKCGVLETRVEGLENKFDQEQLPSLEYQVDTVSRALPSPEAQQLVEAEQRAAAAERRAQQLEQALERAEAAHQGQREALQRDFEKYRSSFQARIDTLTLENESIRVEMAVGKEALEHATREHSGHQEVIQQLRDEVAVQLQLHQRELSLKSQQVDTHHNSWQEKLLEAQQQIDDHVEQVSHHKYLVQGLEEEVAKHLQAARQQAADHAEQLGSHERRAQGLQEELVTAQAAHRQAAEQAEQHQSMTRGFQEELATAQAAHRQAAEQAEQHQSTVSELMQERIAAESAHRSAFEQVEQHQVTHRQMANQLEEARNLLQKIQDEKSAIEAAHKHTTLNMEELEARSGRERSTYEAVKHQLVEQAAELEHFKAEALAAQARAEAEEQNFVQAREAVALMQQELQELRDRCNAYAVLQEECAELRRQIGAVTDVRQVQQVQSLTQWQQAADAIGANFDAGLAQLDQRVSADQQHIMSLRETVHAQLEREQQLQQHVRQLQEQLSFQDLLRPDVVELRSNSPLRPDVVEERAGVIREARVLPASRIRVQAPEVSNGLVGPASGPTSPLYSNVFSPSVAADIAASSFAAQVIQEPPGGAARSVTISNPVGRTPSYLGDPTGNRTPSYPGGQIVSSNSYNALQVKPHTPGLPGPGQVGSYTPSMTNQLSGSVTAVAAMPMQAPSAVGSNTPAAMSMPVLSATSSLVPPKTSATSPAPPMVVTAVAPSNAPPQVASPRHVGPSRYSGGQGMFLAAAVPNFASTAPGASGVPRALTPVRRLM